MGCCVGMRAWCSVLWLRVCCYEVVFDYVRCCDVMCVGM